MITQAENSKLILKIHLPEQVFSSFEQAKDFFKETTQQTKESLAANAGKAVNTITTVTDKAVGSVSATAKASLKQTLQKVDQLSDATSNAMQTAISDSVSEWLQAHPLVFRLVQLLLWATNHPIVSLIILLFAVAIAFSLIKALNRLIEIAGLSLLQAPLKLGQFLIALSTKSLSSFGGLAVKQFAGTNTAKTPVLQNSNSELIPNNKQQRLVEISSRLEAIQKEQNELLQEISALLASDKMDVGI